MTAPPSNAPTPKPTNLAFGAAVTTLSSVVVIVTAVAFAALVAAKFGRTASTDGFYIAFGFFGLFSSFAQSWRSTIVARLLESPSTFGAFNRCVGAVILFSLVSGLVLLAVASPLASLLTGSLPSEGETTARTALLVLWPAVGAQLFAGLAASMLGALGDYIRAAAAYGAGGVVGVVGLLALEPALGIDAPATSILLGSLTSAVLIALALTRAGWRPQASILLGVVENIRALWMLLYSSLSNIGPQVATVVAISAAARLGEGNATLYSYANAGQAVLKSLVALSLPIVLAEPLAKRWNRRAATLRPYIDDTLRSGLVLLIPAVAAAIFLGQEIGQLLLSRFSTADIDQIVETFLVLSLAIVASQVALVDRMALLTTGRYGVLAFIQIPQVALQLALCIAAVSIGSLTALAATVVISFAAGSVTMVALVHRQESWAALAHAAREIVRIVLPATACFALAALLARGLAPPVDAVAGYVGGLILYAVTTATLLPPYRLLAIRLLRSLRRTPLVGRA